MPVTSTVTGVKPGFTYTVPANGIVVCTMTLRNEPSDESFQTRCTDGASTLPICLGAVALGRQHAAVGRLVDQPVRIGLQEEALGDSSPGGLLDDAGVALERAVPLLDGRPGIARGLAFRAASGRTARSRR